MSNHYRSIAFTPPVLEAQEQYGSRAAVARTEAPLGRPPRDPLGGAEREFVAAQDIFFLATTSSDGWPYVQLRGGPRGFVSTPDAHTLRWADLRGNRQYISTGNLAHDPRVALIFVDQARRLRLKIFGIATVQDARGADPDEPHVRTPGSIVERDVRVDVQAFDWNCPQHITQRFTRDELQPVLTRMANRIAELEGKLEEREDT
nr:pyridoxamine 5'-phosphate oxidase family protein [uncultured Nocardioides sp.]